MESTVTDENSTSKLKDLIQIQVDEDEVSRRITKFIDRKRKEVNEANVQEFCNHKLIDEDDPNYDTVDSCARTDGVLIPRFGSKSRIKISRVENKWGPQTNPSAKRMKEEPQIAPQRNDLLEALDERLKPIESHLKIKDSKLKNIVQRLKECEDRVLFLESTSPEYFQISRPNFTSPKKKIDEEVEKTYSNWSIDDLQKRIQMIKESLKVQSKSKTEPKDS